MATSQGYEFFFLAVITRNRPQVISIVRSNVGDMALWDDKGRCFYQLWRQLLCVELIAGFREFQIMSHTIHETVFLFTGLLLPNIKFQIGIIFFHPWPDAFL